MTLVKLLLFSATLLPLGAVQAQSGETTTQPAPKPRMARISSGVMAGLLVHKVEPVYPPVNAQGAVVFHAVIGGDGHVKELTAVQGPEVLRKAAYDAVIQWVYKPYLLNGEPTDVDTTIVLNFRR